MFPDARRDREVTAADVNRVAAAYLKPANMHARRVPPDAAPDRAVILAAPEPEQWLQAYTGRAALKQAEVFDARPPTSMRARVAAAAAGGRATASWSADPRQRGRGDVDAKASPARRRLQTRRRWRS